MEPQIPPPSTTQLSFFRAGPKQKAGRAFATPCRSWQTLLKPSAPRPESTRYLPAPRAFRARRFCYQDEGKTLEVNNLGPHTAVRRYPAEVRIAFGWKLN